LKINELTHLVPEENLKLVEKVGGVNLTVQDYIEFSYIIGQILQKKEDEFPENAPDD